jgi:hypothetical protein
MHCVVLIRIVKGQVLIPVIGYLNMLLTHADLIEGSTSLSSYLRHSVEYDCLQFLDDRCFNETLQNSFEVVNVSQLAGLSDTYAWWESLKTVKFISVIYIVNKAWVKEQAWYSCACATFTCIAVDYYDMLWILYMKPMGNIWIYFSESCTSPSPIQKDSAMRVHDDLSSKSQSHSHWIWHGHMSSRCN